MRQFADLVISKLSHSPEHPTTHTPITFVATVKNIGNVASAPCTMTFRIGGETTPSVIDVPALEPDETYMVRRREHLKVAQRYRNTVRIDVNDEVPESREDNNEAIETYTVNQAAPGVTNDLDYGAYYGYQAWHLSDSDGHSPAMWQHWFDDNTPDSAHIHGDLWPDLKEYTQLYDTVMKYQDGSTCRVYSCYDKETVDMHVKWMKDYGLNGLFLQRQELHLDDDDMREWRDRVAHYVKRACFKYDVKFCMMPCNNDKQGRGQVMVDNIINDWKHLVDDLKITASPQYMHQNGKPVIGFWGLGFDNRPMTPAEATEILDFFQNAPQERYRVYVMGGVPQTWRTNPKAGWTPIFNRLDMISPWRTIFADPYDPQVINRMIGDLEHCDQLGIDYNPVISPGASASHMRSNPSLRNWKPRDGGNYIWKQAYEVCRRGAKFTYVAMFDEIDEGTAMYKLARSAADCPAGADQVPLDIDGYNLPEDWYLRVGREIQKMLDGTIPLTPQLPLTSRPPFP